MEAFATMSRPALLIIDMQNDFVSEGSPMRVADAPRVIPNIKAVLEIFRKKRYPVFHIVRVHRKDGCDVEIFRKEKFRQFPFAVEGTRGARIIDELAPGEGEHIIRKIRMSAFLNTDLDLILRSLGISTVIIVGIQTPNCIRTTAFDAFALNYRTVLVEDAVAAQNNEIHRSNLRDMANIGIQMVRTAEIGDLLNE